jgi:hypothetical protein
VVRSVSPSELLPRFFPDGTEAAPGIAFAADNDNGAYRAAANDWHLVVAGDTAIRFTATSVVVNEDAADRDFRIEGDTDANLLVVDAGLDSVYIGIATPAAGSPKFHVAGDRTAAAWSLNGIQASFAAATYTDNSTLSSGTAATAAAYSIGRPTFAATNTLVTITDAGTLVIAGAPIAGTNVTLTSAYSLIVDQGTSRFDGPARGEGATGDAYINFGGTGSAVEPNYAYTGDLNTGHFRPAADVLATTTGGVERMRVDASGNLLLNATAVGTSAARTLALGNASIVMPTLALTDLVHLGAVDIAAADARLAIQSEAGSVMYLGNDALRWASEVDLRRLAAGSLAFYRITASSSIANAVVPGGTVTSGAKASWSVFGTDFVADSTNYEALILRADAATPGTGLVANAFHVVMRIAGTGTARPFILGHWNGTTLSEHIRMNVSGTTAQLGFYGATPISQGASVADAAGGATIDAEARTAINALISRIEATGLIVTV